VQRAKRLQAMLCALSLVSLVAAAAPAATVRTDSAEIASYRASVEEFKQSSRGPFSRIRWFCRDGTVQPPEVGCREHEGGVQHGELNERAVQLRSAGYYVANILADADQSVFLEGDAPTDALLHLLLEQFLVAADDGWIFRRARFYRGALQAEDEAAGGRSLLLSMVEQPRWREQYYLVLREAVRLVPHTRETPTVFAMRELAASIAARDPAFDRLRTKIHVRPGPEDAAAVRQYARARADRAGQLADYDRLADAIDAVYQADASARLAELAPRIRDRELGRLVAAASSGARGEAPGERLKQRAALLAAIRDRLDGAGPAAAKLDLLDVSLALETEVFTAANRLLDELSESSRAERLQWLGDSVAALYGSGLITHRQRSALAESLARLTGGVSTLGSYRREVEYLARVVPWAERNLQWNFGRAVERIARIEPLAAAYVHDRLRGSPLLFFGQVADNLAEDGNRLAGVRRELFDRPAGAGLRALNAGLARGVLRLPPDEGYDPAGIYLLAETAADLTPVAGILTASEGNPVSHVQLLARNLGIPNVLAERRLLSALHARVGRRVVLAASHGGAVVLDEDGPQWDAVFGAGQPTRGGLIRPDPARLDLKARDVIRLGRLDVADSGRIVGPKAANLGSLKRHFPEAVADGLVLPFGVFRAVLERPIEPGGPSAIEWMAAQYAALAGLPEGSERRRSATAAYLARVREFILAQQLGPEMRARLRAALDDTFGADGSYGVFVRSDTNVEDLPGFTGAGLNLTVPNVVGSEQILAAIPRVWASPFTDRAFSWRQARMTNPEDVYVSVLLQHSVPVEKSGVLVTVDVDSGRRGVLSVAVNEGVGGAVDNQAAEDLRIDLQHGGVRLMAEATAPRKRVLDPNGGMAEVPTGIVDAVLSDAEIGQLRRWVSRLPEVLPTARDGDGALRALDIEFGFLDGRFYLFQLRPFVDSKGAAHSLFLQRLDQSMVADDEMPVDLQARP
jgi:hypothetical protein